jgi:tetratricopeptide (TPR) repeat protein
MADTLTTPPSAANDSRGITAAVRPQPVGAFPLPLGYMLIPAGDDTEEARAALLAGRLPTHWPDAMSAHRHALAGDRTAAIESLDAQRDPVARYNRFVLDPDGDDPQALRAVLGEFAVMVDVVLFALGRTDAAPDASDVDFELAAVALSAQASAALAAGDPADALHLLDAAVEHAADASPALTGILLSGAAAICRDMDDAGAAARLGRALKALDGAAGLPIAKAEIHLCLAGLLHEQSAAQPELLAQAVPRYHSALQLVQRADAPLLWAAAHAGLGAAYLTMPMVEASSQLRLGVAAQSLRAALTVYTREDHPREWAAAQLNLANSLVYTPSRHQADNLVEAVELYEAVLETRDRDADPVGRARALANQGNVLAHLGVFDQAKAKLYEARFLFEEAGDHESVRAVRGVLDEIARERALAKTGDQGDPNVHNGF